MKNKFNDLANLKLSFQRIDGDSAHLLVNVEFKQNILFISTNDVEVRIEAGVSKKQFLKLERLENSDIWYGQMIIPNTVDEVYYFDRNLTLKLIESRKISYKPSYSYAS